MSEHDLPSYRTLSVIVPVYNERTTVAEVVRRMRRVALPLDLEIVIVDDGSADGTDKILSALADSTLRVVHHDVNRGKGAAIRTGLAHARGDVVLVQDADLEYDPDDWPRLLDPLLKGKAKVVFGSRFRGERSGIPLGSLLANRVLVTAANVLYNTSLSDLETGYKLFDRRVLDGITIESDRFEVEPELTAKLLRDGHRIYEVPISFAGRTSAEGKKFSWRDGVAAFTTLVRLRFRR